MRTRRGEGGGTLASAATVMLHGAAVFAVLFSRAGPAKVGPPVYKVELIAAPAPEPNARKAPEVMQREAASPAAVPKKVAPVPKTVAKTPPPPTPKPDLKREPAPRTTATDAPAPGVKPSTGTDVATVKTAGVEFPYPEYLRNLVAQVYRRWERPTDNVVRRAEVLFFVHRDGTVTGLQFVRRSGDFAFDLEAQGAIEAASAAFGKLPEGFESDLLPVSFFFDPQTVK